MENRRSANLLSGIRGICDGDMGHNYGLPDCLAFLWERAEGTQKPDFWDFAAVTGDTVAQVYNRNSSTHCEYCVSGYLAGPAYIGGVFDALGYDQPGISAVTKKHTYAK